MKFILTEQERNEIRKMYGTITEESLSYQTFKNVDYNAFVTILKGIKAPVTTENIAFMYAWRECENSLGVTANFYCNNPFNTTWNLDPKGVVFCSEQSKMYCRKNSAGVKSYKNINYGIEATVKTIVGGKYPNLLNALRNSEVNKMNCLQIAQSLKGDLNTWGTQDNNVIAKCKSYLNGATPAPANIVQVTGCK